MSEPFALLIRGVDRCLMGCETSFSLCLAGDLIRVNCLVWWSLWVYSLGVPVLRIVLGQSISLHKHNHSDHV